MKDLTNLKTYIIDSDDPHEVDDAISLEIKEGNIKNLWIHISNPCKLFLHDSNIDLEARRKNSSKGEEAHVLGKHQNGRPLQRCNPKPRSAA